jgi:hypothetical protein
VPRVAVAIELDATPDEVWSVVEDVAGHVEWMADARAIRFTSPQRAGVGTEFDCDTQIGPLRLVDRMRITTWEPGRAMGVRHVGLVRGEGVFRLGPLDGGHRTRFSWTEELRFPWHLGGPLAALVAAPVLRLVWARNLAALRRTVERRLAGPPRDRG